MAAEGGNRENRLEAVSRRQMAEEGSFCPGGIFEKLEEGLWMCLVDVVNRLC
jgi:hypothetical protein